MIAQHIQDYMAATEGSIEEFTLNEMTRLDFFSLMIQGI